MCSLAIDINRLRVNQYRFRCCRLPTPFVCVWCEHIGFVLCESHKCIYDVPMVELKDFVILYWSFIVAMHVQFPACHTHSLANQYLASDVWLSRFFVYVYCTMHCQQHFYIVHCRQSNSIFDRWVLANLLHPYWSRCSSLFRFVLSLTNTTQIYTQIEMKISHCPKLFGGPPTKIH